MREQKTVDVDIKRRRMLVAATGVMGAIGATFLATPFVASWEPSERAKALGAPVDVDISKLEDGQLLTVNWRGKPVWVLKRTPEMLATLDKVESELRDPDSNESIQPPYCKNNYRAIKPEMFVAVGVCTHLGCAPLFKPDPGDADLGSDWPGGFFCPCHGSRFDLAGRVFKAVPAPTNLEIPPHHYRSATLIRVGEDPKEGGQA
ncbi:ubiquinol-cytochrome c reductase iron-sulfur subunit [Sulfurivirga caldicuralii]|uniref:Ubiquinol-cytochrome c reductase iron-sulfur subunit n=1 Tax=Sulfurivirga caldicuralii TaxID=364032 RepID=A0A1N6G2L7_9GAMM|nr:ubiquinol-cytochrome c reductase iron-sulfur subunit [Sulfurivirga caldicuralii]SIO01758.1 ubiquinol-cytochrome c reductase iron-sulfur subunit [Sulfurivirga caldicuralii]